MKSSHSLTIAMNTFKARSHGKQRTRKSGLAYSAQGLLSALKELGVKEIYAPVDVKPLTILINTMTRVTCYNNGIQSSGLP